MAKQLSPEAVAQIEGRRPIIAGAARLVVGDQPEDRFCFFSGIGSLELDGDTFLGIGNRGLIVPIQTQIGGAAEGINITVSALDPDVAATIEGTEYSQKPMTIWRLVFAPDTFTLLDAMVFMRGRLDYVTQIEKVGDKASLVFYVEGPRRDMNRSGARTRSNADQRTLGGANDGGMKWVSTVARKTLLWGQSPSTASSSLGGRPSGPSRVILGIGSLVG